MTEKIAPKCGQGHNHDHENNLNTDHKYTQSHNNQERFKYRIEGEFCPNCAAKMERILSSTPGFGETTINYAAKTVFLPPMLIDQAQEIMRGIEPGVKLAAIKEKRALEDTKNDNEDHLDRKQLLTILVAAVLLVIGLVFGSHWHNSNLEVLEYAIYLSAYLLVGFEVLEKAVRNIIRGAIFDENFLMALATVGAIAIHQLSEAVGVMLFYSVGELIENRAADRSRRSIKALVNIRPDYANLLNQLDVTKVDPEDVLVGQQILVRPGEKVPLDGEILHGSSFVDTSALTGESVPRKVNVGDTVLAGMINNSGVLTVKVMHEFADSSVQKILDLVENASSRKANTEKFITTFARYYTPGVVAVALGIALIPPLFMGGVFSEWLYRAMTILVISCPCALVISVPLGYFGGIGGASRQGILVKGANYLEALTNVRTVLFDKTGTLTEGVFQVVKIAPVQGFTENTLLELAAKAEIHSNHPIAKSIREKFGKILKADELDQYQEISGQGIQATIKGQYVLAGKEELIKQAGIEVPSIENKEAGTLVHLAIDGAYAGYILIADRVKVGSRETIARLNTAGIKTVMLTGDQEKAAQAIADDLQISEHHSDLLPEHKVAWLESYLKQSGKGKVVFVGDGINDAPVLTRADIGVAMGGLGSDAAIEAADVVLMEDQPGKLIDAIDIAQYTKKIIWQNIAFALIIKLVFIILGMFGAVNMWEAVFADVGVAVLAILNATRIIRYSIPGQMAEGGGYSTSLRGNPLNDMS
ncbi:zinc-transporting ATPase [Desulfosporosinus acididurans]|uniref:Cd(2+)-exporting ATPase n=1 Tax=Desulfosporosinus acididurans TaxID=476652 RepID=A0A0J1FKT1_9FIRM|nr:heavy metal translocating P-type ATPase [Desulfosporosinus acididurans]KLU64094.1 zinc-transporting ATPase [Desulfosporosinus acididurans]